LRKTLLRRAIAIAFFVLVRFGLEVNRMLGNPHLRGGPLNLNKRRVGVSDDLLTLGIEGRL